jgi:hypothetical protein
MVGSSFSPYVVCDYDTASERLLLYLDITITGLLDNLSIPDAKEKIDDWMEENNSICTHGALDNLTSWEFAETAAIV